MAGNPIIRWKLDSASVQFCDTGLDYVVHCVLLERIQGELVLCQILELQAWRYGLFCPIKVLSSHRRYD